MPALKLEQGRTYRAIVRVDVPRLVVSRSNVQRRFAELGFSNVTAWLDVRDLPSDWRVDAIRLDGGGWPAFVQGRWDGASTELERPEAVLDAWPFEPGSTGEKPDELGETMWRMVQLMLLRAGTKLAKEGIGEVFG